MADRGGYRGGRGSGPHGHHRGGRGGGGRGGGQGPGAHAGGAAGEQKEKAKKENILDLAKYMDKRISVKFSGGREGYDALMNLVLDEVQEVVRDEDGNESTRSLGLVVARGTLLVVVSPVDGSEPIANPYVNDESD